MLQNPQTISYADNYLTIPKIDLRLGPQYQVAKTTYVIKTVKNKVK